VAPPPIPGTLKDVWFCWSPSFSGTAQLAVPVAQLSGEVYAGCGCPRPASDRSRASTRCRRRTPFQVECGQRYLIRIGAEIYPFPQVNPLRTFAITKESGQDCPLPTGQNCAECCGGKPEYIDPLYSANYTGQVAVVTESLVGRFGNGSANVLTVFNFASTPAPIPGGLWNPVPGNAPTAFRYTKPNWDSNTLGSVFPVTLDNAGNVYTAYCAATNLPLPSSLSGSTSGSIFKIATGSGAPSVFCNLPDSLAPAVGNCAQNQPIDCSQPNPFPCPPGIGDVTVDCGHSGQLFATCFADGRIYRISSAGATLQAYDHATNAIQLPIREVGNTYDRYVNRGERVWAVKVHSGRLYYSVWGQEIGCSGGAGLGAPGYSPNSVWSIALDSAGAFVANSRRMELQAPAFPPLSDPTYQESAPISDISFSPDCKMMLAERVATENGVLLGAHVARGLEYAWNGAAWVPTFQRSGYGQPVGIVISGVPNTNSCGGCDYDFATGSAPLGRVWMTGDQLQGGVFGITGIDRTTPSVLTNFNIQYAGAGAKATMCDVEIPCVGQPCATFIDGQVLCVPGPVPGTYSYTFKFKNNSTVPVQYLLFPSPNITPHVVTLPTPVPPNGTSGPITINLTAVQPGTFCFDMTLADEAVQECCRVRQCITLPDCDCLQLPLARVDCIPGTPGSFKLTFTVQNLGGMTVNELYIFPPIGSGITAMPDYFMLPLLLPNQTSGVLSTTISGATPGTQVCLRFSVHLDGEECCSEVICFTVPMPCSGSGMPQPCTPGGLCYADCDGSGALNILDFICFMNNYASGAACANCDGTTQIPVLNVNDFTCFLNKYAAGCS
jgi:hypothetical protein